MDRKGQASGTLLALVAIVLVAGIALLMWGWPKYRIYRQELRGEAAMREAAWTRRIDSIAAYNRLEVRRLEAIGDSVEAMGLAAANRITMESLGGPQNWLTYRWIEGLSAGDVVYVPTENQLPLLRDVRPAAPPRP